jgi:hypothetical protein
MEEIFKHLDQERMKINSDALKLSAELVRLFVKGTIKKYHLFDRVVV